MTTKEAEIIIGYIIKWQFVFMSVTERESITERIDLSNYSLQDLITANNLTRANNRRKEKIMSYNNAIGRKTKGCKIHMVLDDRVIAAVYTALHHQPNNQIIALIDDVGVGCVRANYN